MKVNWKGVIPAITTPFNANLSVDEGLLAERRPTDLTFDHRSGRFAGPEAGDAHTGRQPAIRLVDRLQNLVGVHFDGQNDLRAGLLLGIDLDRRHGFYATSSLQIRKRPIGQPRSAMALLWIS